jgi:Flp pilus assembly protein TadB
MQWLDELDDLVSMVAAKSESLRRLLRLFGNALLAGTTLALGVAALFVQPLIATVAAALLAIAVVYQRAQQKDAVKLQPAGD